jgi:Putative Ig domain
MSTRLRVVTVAIVLGLLLMLAACGGGKSTPPPATPVVTVAVAPDTYSMSVTGTKQFSATITGSTNTAVTWSASKGTITTDGTYTPPLKAGSYTITATSAADTSKSASATVTVTAPAPTVTSIAPTNAVEGAEYTYQLTGTDPAETPITFALTAGPDGATIDGDTITWTPTPGQSRVTNSFTVTATTDAGGTASKTFSVTPAGTVTVSCIDKSWAADGTSTDQPWNLTDVGWISAQVPSEDGTSLTPIEGTGNAEGLFTIAGVPAGHYWLQFDQSVYWTDSSTFDCGSDYIGRNDAETVSTTLDFNMQGLTEPWNYSWVSLVIPNVQFVQGFGGVDYTTFQGEYGYEQFPVLDPENGDAAYLLQWDTGIAEQSRMAGEAQAIAITSGLALNSLAVNPDGGTTTPITGIMGGTPNAFDVNVKSSEWAKALIKSGPAIDMSNDSIFTRFGANLMVLPFVNDIYANRPLFVAHVAAPPSSVDRDLGVMRYVNPYPGTWTPVFAAHQYALYDISLPGSDGTIKNVAGMSYMTSDVPTGPIAPIMSGVQNPKINGNDFFTMNTSGSDVTLSWDAPSGLAPFAYEVRVITLGRFVAVPMPRQLDFYTTETSLTIPSVVLQPGTYMFKIKAMADARAKIESPFRSKLPIADSAIVSGVLTIEGTPETPSVALFKTLTMDGTRKALSTKARIDALKERSDVGDPELPSTPSTPPTL